MLYESFDGKLFDNYFLCLVYEAFHQNQEVFKNAKFLDCDLDPIAPWLEDFWSEGCFMFLPNEQARDIVQGWFEHEGFEGCLVVGTMYFDRTEQDWVSY